MVIDETQVIKSKEFVKRSSVYQEFLAERDEILKLKWIASEQTGEDIGFERALLNWVRHHREDWLADRRSSLCSANAD